MCVCVCVGDVCTDESRILLDRMGHHGPDLLYAVVQTLPDLYVMSEKNAALRKIDLCEYSHA